MNAIQQKCRPKHQVLVLKCFPPTARGTVDVKPNSSELSYLLFYASSRRSKIQKVGQFLEKKTASDVWRLRIGYVSPSFLSLPLPLPLPPPTPPFPPSVESRLPLIPTFPDLQECTGHAADLSCSYREISEGPPSIRVECPHDPQPRSPLQ